MTTEFVLRLDKKRAERLKQEARKRRQSRNALVQQAIDNLLDEPRSAQKAKIAKPQSGVGWPARLRELEELSRTYGDPKLKGRDVVAEIRSIDRNRWR